MSMHEYHEYSYEKRDSKKPMKDNSSFRVYPGGKRQNNDSFRIVNKKSKKKK